MTRAEPGRHRASRPDRRVPVWALVLGLLAVVILGSAAGWLMWGPTEPANSPTATTSPSTTETMDDKTGKSAELTVSRAVRLSGSRVTVSETIAASDGDVSIVPSRAPPGWGLRQRSVGISAQDGTSSPFAKPVDLVAGGSITITGRYQLTGCPDVLPTHWPTPSRVAPGDWSRTVVFSESPQLTSRTLCPNTRSTAKQLPGLTGSLRPAESTVVRLKWRGDGPLTVRTVGSASGVAAIAKAGSCPDGCLTRIPGGQVASVRLKVVEPCPVGAQSPRLTLILDKRDAGNRVIRLMIPKLGKSICAAGQQ